MGDEQANDPYIDVLANNPPTRIVEAIQQDSRTGNPNTQLRQTYVAMQEQRIRRGLPRRIAAAAGIVVVGATFMGFIGAVKYDAGQSTGTSSAPVFAENSLGFDPNVFNLPSLASKDQNGNVDYDPLSTAFMTGLSVATLLGGTAALVGGSGSSSPSKLQRDAKRIQKRRGA